MTWYAHNLYLPAADRVLDLLKAHPAIRPCLYQVTNLNGFPWHTPEVVHGLGPLGLAAVRPLAPTNEHCSEWYGEPVLPWDSLRPTSSGRDVRPYVDDVDAPPTALLQFVAELSTTTGLPALYCASFRWGGEIDFEAAWVFTPNRHTYVTEVSVGSEVEVRIIDGNAERRERGDALRRGLMHLGIDLPTAFFALHTRSFPWERHRVA